MHIPRVILHLFGCVHTTTGVVTHACIRVAELATWGKVPLVVARCLKRAWALSSDILENLVDLRRISNEVLSKVYLVLLQQRTCAFLAASTASDQPTLRWHISTISSTCSQSYGESLVANMPATDTSAKNNSRPSSPTPSAKPLYWSFSS